MTPVLPPKGVRGHLEDALAASVRMKRANDDLSHAIRNALTIAIDEEKQAGERQRGEQKP